MNVLIIEDEAKAARELANLLKNTDDEIQVLAILDSVEQSLEWLAANNQPDLIFSDIQLADGLCFDIYQQITLSCPVIFCTAFDEYLLNAFETNAISYILKPVTREKVETALGKYQQLKSFFSRTGEPDIRLMGLLKQLKFNYKTALLVHQKEKIIPLPVGEIAYFYLDRTMVHVYTRSNQKYYIPGTLEELEKVLNPADFYRANRQFIIQKTAVANAERFFARKLVAKMSNDTPEPVIISKAKSTEFLKWLEGW